MLGIILRIVSVLIILIGVIIIYDSRPLTKRFFGFGDQNQATSGLKIIGLIITLIGLVILYFNR